MILRRDVRICLFETSSTTHCSLFYVGFKDGHVAYFRFEDSNDTQHDDELVLCPLDELSNLVSEMRLKP